MTNLERITELAMQLGARHLDAYGAAKSRHDFTQRQLLSCLLLKAYLKTTYRGVLDILATSEVLRQRLGLTDKLPHYTTLQKFSARSQVQAIAAAILAQLGGLAEAAAQQAGRRVSAAVDATGLEKTVASAHYQSRRGATRHRYVKVSAAVLCGSLLPVGLVVSWGPRNDKCHAAELLEQTFAAVAPARLYADAGYDAEWVHACAHAHGTESLIRPVVHRADGTLGGHWRSRMTPAHLQARGYGQRWQVESFFSALKRKLGSTLSSRIPAQLLKEATLKVLAYALHT
jgi:Transposase DDE domain